MHGLEEASAGQVRQPSRIVAVGLVSRKPLERLVGLAARPLEPTNPRSFDSQTKDQKQPSGAHDLSSSEVAGQFEYDDAFALARLALTTHVKKMDKPHTKFEPIQLKGYSGWHVRITLPHGVQNHISYFKTEAEARTWIGENSTAWRNSVFEAWEASQ